MNGVSAVRSKDSDQRALTRSKPSKPHREGSSCQIGVTVKPRDVTSAASPALPILLKIAHGKPANQENSSRAIALGRQAAYRWRENNAWRCARA
jgi:hypothetical protein